LYSVIEKVIFLQDIDVFSEVRVEDLTHLAAIAQVVSFQPDETLYKMDESADSLHLIISGSVRLHQEGREIAIAAAGEAVGTWALFDNQPRVATATALEETDTLCIMKEDFYDMLSDNVRIAESVLRSLARRLRSLTEAINPR